MAQLQYIGYVEKTLVDIGPVVNGTTFVVDDDTAARFIAAYPNDYVIVVDAPIVSAPAAQVATDVADTTDASQDATTTTTSKKSASSTTTN